MQVASVGPVRVPPDLRRDVDTACQIRDVSLQDYVIEALERLVQRDRSNNEVGFAAINEAKRRLEQEVEQTRSKGA